MLDTRPDKGRGFSARTSRPRTSRSGSGLNLRCGVKMVPLAPSFDRYSTAARHGRIQRRASLAG